MFPMIIGYFTVDTPYEQEAESLKLTLDAFKYKYDILPVPNLGSWQKNTQYKAKVVRAMMNKYPGQPLLYLDVDSLVLHPLDIFDNMHTLCDIAAVHFHNSTELLSGTVFFSGSQLSRRIVDQWIALNLRYPIKLPDGREAWDQRTLRMAIHAVRGATFKELPQEYTWIAQLSNSRMPGKNAIILHTRGAYRFKKRINEGS